MYRPGPTTTGTVMMLAVVAVTGVGLIVSPIGASAVASAMQKLTWHICVTGEDDETGAALAEVKAECTEVTVPVDYSAPDGATIKVAISRMKAGKQAGWCGVLLVNPGGPGLGLPAMIRAGAPKLAGAYDLIGMDPRFVGRSNPIPCVHAVATSPGRSSVPSSARRS